ncbi:MAG: hypothetical protein DRP63_03090 [Planctomycetota bacterium]|nr:MAG: hypothetical protein DRP63_03090 [Planctomycetota bacterium]
MPKGVINLSYLPSGRMELSFVVFRYGGYDRGHFLRGSCHIVWADLRERLNRRLGSKRFNLWLGNARLVAVEGDRVVIGLPSGLHVDMARSHFAEEVASVLKTLLGWKPDVRFVVDRELFQRQRQREEAVRRETAVEWANDFTLPLDSSFGLDYFAVGDANRAAFQRLQDFLSESPCTVCLVGPRATGKSHLAVGVALRFRENFSAKVTYTTPAAFQNALFAAIQRHEQPLFRRTMRECDLFVLDEMETLPRFGRIHQEMLHTLEHLDLRESRVLLVGQVPPSQLALPHRLRSRLQRGPLLRVDYPERDLRAEIVRKLLSRHPEIAPLIPQDIPEVLATRFRCIENLVEATKQVLATAIMYKTCGEAALDRQTLLNAVSHKGESEPRLLATTLAEAFARKIGVAMEDVLSGSRKRDVCRARSLSILALRQLLPDLTLTQIGALFSVSHAAVHQTILRAKRLLKTDASLRALFDDIIKRFRE